MIKKSFTSTSKVKYNRHSIPPSVEFSTHRCRPLSDYIAGATDMTGDELRENGHPMYDVDDSSKESDITSVFGNVDPFADPRVGLFDLVESSGDPDAIAAIKSSIGSDSAVVDDPEPNPNIVE